MDKANLLVDVGSFLWEDLSVDRTNALDKLILALEEINENEDNVYNHPNTLEIALPWGFFYEILSYSYEDRQLIMPWFKNDYQKTLIKIFNRPSSPRPSLNLEQLNAEFKGQNNGLLGINPYIAQRYVRCDQTWRMLHFEYVKNNYHLRKASPKYFKRFYKPELQEDANRINDLIRRGRVNPMFKRLDPPKYINDKATLHGEQTQFHFNDAGKSALNIDGTWKHGGFDLSNDVKEKLAEWGFLLPGE